MPHAGNQEEAGRARRLLRAHRTHHGFVIADRVLRRNDGVGPTLIDQEFAPQARLAAQVRIVGGEKRHLGICVGGVPIEVETVEIPIGIVEDPVPPEIQARRFTLTDEVTRPSGFATAHPSGVEAFSGARIPGPVVDLAHRRDLRCGQAIGVILSATLKDCGVEFAR